LAVWDTIVVVLAAAACPTAEGRLARFFDFLPLDFFTNGSEGSSEIGSDLFPIGAKRFLYGGVR